MSIFNKPLNLRYCGDPVLRRHSEPVSEITSEVHELAAAMIETMLESEGVGLAAPQVGIHLRLAAICTCIPGKVPAPDVSPGEMLLNPRMPLVLVNPEIIAFSENLSKYNEGCLSVPEINADVIRPAIVTLKTHVLGQGEIIVECGGLLARCLQHELDHLNGILFVDRLSPHELQRIKPKLEALERNTSRRLRCLRRSA